MEKVRTTMRPDEEIEVTPTEKIDLDRMGLLSTSDTPATASNRSQAGSGENK